MLNKEVNFANITQCSWLQVRNQSFTVTIIPSVLFSNMAREAEVPRDLKSVVQFCISNAKCLDFRMKGKISAYKFWLSFLLLAYLI